MTKEELLKRIREEGSENRIKIDGYQFRLDNDKDVVIEKDGMTAYLFHYYNDIGDVMLSPSVRFNQLNDFMQFASGLSMILGIEYKIGGVPMHTIKTVEVEKAPEGMQKTLAELTGQVSVYEKLLIGREFSVKA